MRRFVGIITAACAVLAATVTSPEPAEAATVPAGFSDTFIGAFNSPTAVEWMPGDRIVVLEQAGRLRIGRPGQPFTTAIDLDVCSSFEKGLLGFTHDPAFSSSRFVYVYYTRPSGDTCVNRVSRFVLGIDDTIDPASEVVLLDNISAVNGNHNGGDLDIGSDGFLYVAVGDAGRDPRGNSGSGGANDAAQDRSLLNGKILRITLDGQPAPGNPFIGAGTTQCATRGNTALTPTNICQEIFAYGTRNPYRIAFDRNDGTDRFFINDVGQGTFEEVNEGQLGANYGWPVREGSCPQGDTPPCDPAGAGFTDPITSYGRSLGRSITGGAFVPNGLWPERYDGTYLFGDFVTGSIWLREADGSVDYGTPFATGANALTDMTFGFDATGRSTLYYVTFNGLYAITPTTPLPDPPIGDLKLIPVEPFRAYDTGHSIGTPPGKVFNGTTRHVDLDPPGDYEAALVNLTYDVTAGAGFITPWPARGERPTTSSLNAEAPGTIVANSAIVPLDADGTFVFESTTTARVVIDVMAWFDHVPAGTTDDGRFISIEPIRLADTRLPAGEPLDSGSSNPWTATTDGFDVEALGNVGLPDDGTVEAVVISIAAIAGDEWAGWVSAYPGGGEFSSTSNVNVRRGQARANVAVVPLSGASHVGFRTLNVRDIVVDVVGYVTSDTAPSSASGLYQPVDSFRVVDTRIPLGFGTLQKDTPATVTIPGAGSASAVVHNLTVTNTTGPGHVSAHPTPVTPEVSNLNFDGPDQIRAVLAFTDLAPGGIMRYTSFTETEFVVDVLGVFSG